MAESKVKSEPKFTDAKDNIPPEFIIELPFFDKKTQTNKVQKLIRFGGLQYLMDLKGEYRVQTQTTRATSEEIRYEAKVFVIPSDAYLAEKGISKDNPCLSLLLEPVIMHAIASKENTSPMMYKFLDSLGETRAIARAFRIASGCPYTAVDELDRRDLVQKAEETGISVESLEDMINKEQMATIAKKTVPVGAMTRNDMIIHIKNAMKRHKGVNECVKKYLDDRNAMIVENLSDADIKDLHDKSVKLEGGA